MLSIDKLILVFFVFDISQSFPISLAYAAC